MKRYLYLFLLAALACGCNDSEGDGPAGTGSETQQPVSPDEILSRRLVSVDVAPDYDFSYSETFAYDGRGRLASITRFEFENEYSNTYTYTYTYTNNTIVRGETTYRLQNDRVVIARTEEDSEWNYWWEVLFNYDAAGYLASLSQTGNGGGGSSPIV